MLLASLIKVLWFVQYFCLPILGFKFILFETTKFFLLMRLVAIISCNLNMRPHTGYINVMVPWQSDLVPKNSDMSWSIWNWAVYTFKVVEYRSSCLTWTWFFKICDNSNLMWYPICVFSIQNWLVNLKFAKKCTFYTMYLNLSAKTFLI